MLFNSFSFALFFPVVFAIYWAIPGKRPVLQNLVLVVASYFFYGWWDWRFLSLLAGSALFNYFVGILIHEGKNRFRQKLWLIAGLAGNLGVLVVYKYMDFFIFSFLDFFRLFGIFMNFHSIRLIVPLGISFMTFLAVSYLVDIYRKQLLPEKNLVNLSLSFSFFPILLAGPIQRPITLLPQIKSQRIFEYTAATDGLRQVLWGLFVKIVIADNCALYVNEVFTMKPEYGGSTMILGAILFAIQIYADFSAYSNIAIGSARLLGFNLMQNFNYPYFATDIKDFWKRWHISLTTWFRDYVFIPLSYFISRKIKSDKFLFIKTDLVIYGVGIFITWLVTGLWHGAKATFIVWGMIHALFLILHQVQRKPRKRLLTSPNAFLRAGYKGIARIFTLCIVLVSWIVFRAADIGSALDYLTRSVSGTILTLPKDFPTLLLFPISIFFIIEWLQRNKLHGLGFSKTGKYRVFRWSLYFTLLLLMFFYQKTPQEFFYFRF